MDAQRREGGAQDLSPRLTANPTDASVPVDKAIILDAHGGGHDLPDRECQGYVVSEASGEERTISGLRRRYWRIQGKRLSVYGPRGRHCGRRRWRRGAIYFEVDLNWV